MRIALVGSEDRAELVRLAIRLEERGAESLFLDARRDPSIRIDAAGARACGEELNGVRATFVADLGLKSPVVKRPDGTLDKEASRRALASSCRHLAAWNALLGYLESKGPVVNPPATHDLHALKPWETYVYRRLGLRTPVTVATSDARELLELRDRYAGGDDDSRRWIRKGLVGGHGYTEPFTPPETMEEAEAMVSEGPILVQERIEGDNVRAFVIGGELAGAAEVITTQGGEVDSRRGDARVRRIELPEEAARAALTAAAHWNMTFSAVDFMREARSGNYFILECNSAPFFVNFEKQSGIDITSRLASFLVKAAREDRAARTSA